MPRLFQVALDLASALIILQVLPAQVQIVPVDLAAVRLRNERRFALPAHVPGILCPAPHVGFGHWLIVQGPYEFRQPLVGFLAASL
ncbi:hypothetical protein D3C76_1438610 [compost metagenome]